MEGLFFAVGEDVDSFSISPSRSSDKKFDAAGMAFLGGAGDVYCWLWRSRGPADVPEDVPGDGNSVIARRGGKLADVADCMLR